MATSKTTICNMALAELGSTLYVTNIDSPTTKEEKYCALFYPQALDHFLTLDPWAAALTEQAISYNDPASLDFDDNFDYEYDLPADPFCVKAIKILENFEAEFIEAGRKLYTNVQYNGQITLLYNKRVTNISDFKPQEVNAISLLLTYYLAGPLALGKKNVKAESWGWFLNALDGARSVNGDVMKARNIGFDVNPEPPDMESESWID